MDNQHSIPPHQRMQGGTAAEQEGSTFKPGEVEEKNNDDRQAREDGKPGSEQQESETAGAEKETEAPAPDNDTIGIP